VSCDAERVSTTGIQLATWSVPGAEHDVAGPNLAQQVEDAGSLPTFFALVAVLAALALARTAHIGWRFLLALSSTLLIAWLPIRVELGLADVSLGAGFTLAIALLLTAVVVEGRLLVRRRRSRANTSDPVDHGREELGHSLR
jgi:hypothetical protein